MSQESKKRGFAALSPERLRQIASSGGVARKKMYDMMRQEEAAQRPQKAPQSPGAPWQATDSR
jgi:hypothetical protein